MSRTDKTNKSNDDEEKKIDNHINSAKPTEETNNRKDSGEESTNEESSSTNDIKQKDEDDSESDNSSNLTDDTLEEQKEQLTSEDQQSEKISMSRANAIRTTEKATEVLTTMKGLFEPDKQLVEKLDGSEKDKMIKLFDHTNQLLKMLNDLLGHQQEENFHINESTLEIKGNENTETRRSN